MVTERERPGRLARNALAIFLLAAKTCWVWRYAPAEWIARTREYKSMLAVWFRTDAALPAFGKAKSPLRFP